MEKKQVQFTYNPHTRSSYYYIMLGIILLHHCISCIYYSAIIIHFCKSLVFYDFQSFLLLYMICRSYIVAVLSGFGAGNKMIDIYVHMLAMASNLFK